MAGIWPSFLALVACLTGCIAVQTPAEWPSWVKLPKKVPVGNSKFPKEASLEDRNAMTSAPPKPKNLFSDVDDVDFEPKGLTEATKNEKNRDWDSDLDEREEPVDEKCGPEWKDPPMFSHDPRSPCVVHVKVPCVLADESVMPNQSEFRHMVDAFTLAIPMFSIACKGSEMIDECDPITRILEHWKEALKISFNAKDKHIQQDLWEFQKFGKWLMNRSEFSDFYEFWQTLEKEDWKAISEHTMHNAAYNPFLESMDIGGEEELFEAADLDNSGDVSFGELQAFMGAVAQMANLPLRQVPACAKHQGFRKFEVDSQKLIEWVGLVHEKVDTRYFRIGGKRTTRKTLR